MPSSKVMHTRVSAKRAAQRELILPEGSARSGRLTLSGSKSTMSLWTFPAAASIPMASPSPQIPIPDMSTLPIQPLSQTEVAAMTGMTQPKVSQVRRYKLQNISLERLMQALVSLDQRVEIVVRPARRERSAGITVAA